MKIGIIGYGYWGPNIARNFNAVDGCSVQVICDVNDAVLRQARKAYPSVRMASDYREVLSATDIDAVAVVSPVSTHYPLVKEALLHGKHVFVEKPFTKTVAQAQELVDLAEKKKLLIMVDHTFLFTSAVRKIKEFVDNDLLGELYYFDSTRVSLGLFQQDANVIWDLAPHDFSIIDHISRKRPRALTAQGVDHTGHGYENIAYITVYYEDNFIAHINVNWLSPVKIRTTLISGQKKMLVWDDLQSDEKIKVYDKGVDVMTKETMDKIRFNYRFGDMWSPQLDPVEALAQEAAYFVECVREGKRPFNDGASGLRVVRMLEAADESLRNQGKVIQLKF